jgi:hypothetical protein
LGPYQDLIDREQIESIELDPAIVKRKLTGARNKLGVAQKLAKSDSETERQEGYAIAYQAALVALEAWMRHKGYKRTQSAGHVAVLNFARRSLGSEHHKTVRKLHRGEQIDTTSNTSTRAWRCPAKRRSKG